MPDRSVARIGTNYGGNSKKPILL
ncbi:hypothetical protein AAHB61_14195 [Bacillus cereus]